jgi:5-carboxymethyl-2-hydroxymuconic-semialdehyde dehydrogenase
VIFADTDFDRAVDAVVAQIFTLNGQRCTAGSRLIAEERVYEDLVQAVAERARNIRIGDPFDEATELGPLIRPEHHARVTEYLDSAVADGARCLAGGGRPAAFPEGNFLEATVFADVTPEMRVFREEIFGPVLVATPFRGEEEAVRLANATEYGLAGYVWTNDLTRGHRVAQAIDAGLTWINSQNVRDLRTPFGGVKKSGIGREGGHYSFEFYCDLQTVHVALGEHPIPRLGLGGSGS